MKRLKKLLAIVLTVLMMIFSFSGCEFLKNFQFFKDNQVEYITQEEFYSQVAYYGNSENETANTCMRIGFSVKMKAGTSIVFVGNASVYKFGVCEKDPLNDYFYDSGWLGKDSYILKQDSYPIPMIARIDGAALTNEELLSMHTMLEVEGIKLTPTSSDDAGTLSSEEYKSQVAHYGSVPNPTKNTRARISFSIKMQKGSTVKFVGNSNTYKWAVCELYNTSHVNGYLDPGWNTSWNSPNMDYIMHMDGAYPVLTIARKDNKALTMRELSQIYAMFEVKGEKWVKHAEVGSSNSAVKAINHRGYCMKAPENTLAAYRESALHGFTMVECDVWFTSDNHPVLLHDSTIDRTSNGSGSISKMTLKQVRQYDFGSWKDPEYKGEKIPTFDEFMALCSELDLHPYIELKSGLSLEHAQKLIDIVNKYNRIDKVSWISFGADSLKNVLNLYNKARVGYVVNDVTETVMTTVQTLQTGENEVFIDCNYTKVNETDVTLCRNANVSLEIWTFNKPADVVNLNAYVSGVSSDWMIIGDYISK